MITIRTTPKPPVRRRPPQGTGLAPLAAVHAQLTSENARLKKQNAMLKVALARAVIGGAPRLRSAKPAAARGLPSEDRS